MIDNPALASYPPAALVTGAARRIGRAIALDLAGHGWDVALHANRSLDEAHRLAAEIAALGRKAVVLQADLAHEPAVETLVPAAVAALGPLGLLVNNASTFEKDDIATASRASWEAHIEPNLRAPLVLTQAFARQLPADRAGCVVNLIDQRVWNPGADFLSYTVSKAALLTLTRTLALALAPRIRVNAIGPGPVLRSIHQSEAEFAAECRGVPLQRGTDPAEICRTLRFLLEAAAMTGQMIALDGGQHMTGIRA
ncbi:SDR family oxidoreductase [Oceanibaculum pacificum]|uniref:Short-chain dehydrogenase n=1 Tax=Oceanibaculum pacificum TaxID=580166 RepID=A0A154W866_9PROT|nr:SDR family oxidoreductase [Oceanibaculum pacificum]KZD09686.1 short-chain dehydrogenase [Oceanibaculum pacificum]